MAIADEEQPIERITITLPSKMLTGVRQAVATGDYASTSEVIREALRIWKVREEIRMDALRTLRADIERGMQDIANGRTTKWNPPD